VHHVYAKRNIAANLLLEQDALARPQGQPGVIVDKFAQLSELKLRL